MLPERTADAVAAAEAVPPPALPVGAAPETDAHADADAGADREPDAHPLAVASPGEPVGDADAHIDSVARAEPEPLAKALAE